MLGNEHAYCGHGRLGLQPHTPRGVFLGGVAHTTLPSHAT